jgi:hypothetical protein
MVVCSVWKSCKSRVFREISLDSEMDLTTINFRDLDTEVSEVSDEDDESIYIVLINSH